MRAVAHQDLSCRQCGASFRQPVRLDERGRRRGVMSQNVCCSMSCAATMRNLGRGSRGHLDKNGYRVVRVDGASVFEHRLVMERVMGRKLRSEETVHHRDGVRDNNDPKNLELWSSRQPKGQRVCDKIEYCADFLRSYGYDTQVPSVSEMISAQMYLV